MGLAGEERHLADGLARRDGRDQAARALVLADEDTERAGDHEEDGTVVLAVARQLHATGKPEPVGFGKQPSERGFPDVRREREAPETRAERLGKDRISA